MDVDAALEPEDRHERFMREALAIARRGLERGEMPIGAVIVHDDEVVAAAHTQEVTQRRLLVHADLLAIDAADRVLGRRRENAWLYVTLEPCLMCLGAAFTARIGGIVLALESPADGGVSAFQWWDRGRDREAMPGSEVPTLVGGVMRTDAAEMFREYADRFASRGWLADWAGGLASLAAR